MRSSVGSTVGSTVGSPVGSTVGSTVVVIQRPGFLAHLIHVGESLLLGQLRDLYTYS